MITSLFLSVLEVSISVSPIVLVLAMAAPFLNKRYAAKWKYWLWLFLALRLLIPFRGMDVQDGISDLRQRLAEETQESQKAHGEEAGGTMLARRVIIEIPEQMTTPIAVQPRGKKIGITVLDIMAMLWMAGGLLVLSVHLYTYLHYKKRLMKSKIPVKNGDLLYRIMKLKQELQIERTVRLIKSREAASPMILGIFHPVLVLPEEEYGEEELFFILKHELIHLRHRDICLKLLFVAASAVHWFNPFVRLLQKEAVVDMELYCDECVIRGISFAGRKAYTETLLSALHKQSVSRNALSTQFYDGKKIMKKRFQNILSKERKKNGAILLFCAIAVTISLGTLTGCTVRKGNAGDGADRAEIGESHTEVVGNLAETETSMPEVPEGRPETEQTGAPEGQTETEQTGAPEGQPEPSEAAESQPEAVKLTFMIEGLEEQVPATLVTGDGYSFYLPDDEWQQTAPDRWTGLANEQVSFWVEHFSKSTRAQKEKELLEDGYAAVDGRIWRQDGELIYGVELKEYENDVWGICYSYPIDSEEGWGRRIFVIADTFAATF